MPIDATEFGELRATVKSVGEFIEKVDRILYGNGRDGIIQTISRLEGKIDTITTEIKDVKTDVGSIKKTVDEGLAPKVTEYAQKLDIHVKNEFKNLVVKHWKSLLIGFIVLFLILHTVLPPTFTIFNLIEKLF